MEERERNVKGYDKKYGRRKKSRERKNAAEERKRRQEKELRLLYCAIKASLVKILFSLLMKESWRLV